MITKLCLGLAGMLGLILLWRVLHLEQMLRHTQNCMALGERCDLYFRTAGEAKRARKPKKGAA